MKKTFLSVTRAMMLVMSLLHAPGQDAVAQCFTEPSSPGNTAQRGPAADCNKASAAFTDYFRKVEHYKPFPLQNPHTTTPKVVKLRVIVVTNTFYAPNYGYPQHFGNTSADNSRIVAMLEEWCNNANISLSHNGTPYNPRTEVCSTQCYIEDSKLRFKVVDINRVTTHENMKSSQSGYGQKSKSTKYHLDQYGYADQDSILNVFLVNYSYEGDTVSTGHNQGLAYYPNWFSFNKSGTTGHGIIMFGSYNNEWAQYTTFMHEVGHALSLYHTHDQGECIGGMINANEFLYDVFGPSTSFCMFPNPAGCDPSLPANKDKCSNNLMGKIWYAQHYLSPTQMGRMQRAAHLSSSARFIYPVGPPDILPWQITSDQTWDFAIRVYQDIIVKAGNTLTITCEVQMPPGSRILVERGAKLVIDGGTITAYHPKSSWLGIQLYGDKNAPPYEHNQGTLVMRNQAAIEYAYEGVRDYIVGTGIGGGIIQAVNSTFKDCSRAVELNDYPNYARGTSCYFTNVTFLTENAEAPTNRNRKDFPMVSSYNERGVLINNCTFKNTIPMNTPFFDLEQRNRAIYSEDAGFRIQNSSFKGYKQAIHIGNHSNNPFRSVKVMNCTFDSLGTGIVFADNFSYAQGNTFNYPLNYVYIKGLMAYLHEGEAIYADNAGGLTITTNTILNSGSNPNTRGITINSSLPTGSRVIDNHIADARLGITVQKNNPYLDLLCNHFTGGDYNFVLNPQSSSGQLKDQGNGCAVFSNYRAGNTFSPTAIRHIASYLNNPAWSYYYWAADPAQVPVNISGTFNNIGCNGTGEDPNSMCGLAANVESAIDRMTDEAFQSWPTQVVGPPTTQQMAEFAGIVQHFNETDDMERLVDFLEAIPYTDVMKLLPALYLEREDYGKLDDVLSKIALDVDAAEYAAWLAYYDILRALKQKSRSIYELTPGELAQIREIAEDSFDISARAKSLLAFAYGEVWHHEQEQLPPLPTSKVVDNPLTIGMSILYDAVPNPAQTHTRIDVDLAVDDASNSRLVIRNVMGMAVQEYVLSEGRQSVQVNLMNLPAGVYTYTLVNNGKIIRVKRLVVLK